MRVRDHGVGRPPTSAGWRVATVVLTTVLAAVACTVNRAETQSPTTPSRSSGVPAATSNDGSPPPARNLRGLIAYSTQAGDIWVMDADGSNRRQVTRTGDPAFDFDPSLSPDGRRVVFRTSRGRYVPDRNGTGVHSLPQLRGAGDPIDWLIPVG